MEIASFEDKNIITGLCNEIISKLDYPEHKRKNVEIITKRIIGRAFIAVRESKMLRGTLKRINVRIQSKEE
jgi:tRNA C32,U32 (ribose-2'-O)-methylase TrmJ